MCLCEINDPLPEFHRVIGLGNAEKCLLQPQYIGCENQKFN